MNLKKHNMRKVNEITNELVASWFIETYYPEALNEIEIKTKNI